MILLVLGALGPLASVVLYGGLLLLKEPLIWVCFVVLMFILLLCVQTEEKEEY